MIDYLRDADRLATLRDYQLVDTPAEANLDAIVADAARYLGTPIAMISLVDDQRQWFKAKHGTDRSEDPVDHSICARAICGDDLYVVADASTDERFSHFPGVCADGGIRFYAGAPLKMRNGARLGTLCVIDVAPRGSLDAAERLALEALARRTVAAFELRRDLLDAVSSEATLEAREQILLADASKLLARAAAMLDLVGASGVAAHLEHVIALVDDRRTPASPACSV
ncbi:MAG TPA: GAF domain-containing protein [Sphingomonas sp.]|jgi:GAF domain-containing protein|nr:GAF domain-containing protein [Sphingomonas sp.]